MKRTRFSARADTCGICLGLVEFQGELDTCTHAFCYQCIVKWASVRLIQTENSCPICRSRFSVIHRKRRRVEYFSRKKQPPKHVPDKSQSRALSAEEVSMLVQSTQILLSSQNNSLISMWGLCRDNAELDMLNRLTRILAYRIQNHNLDDH